jgi:hypothetical protein
MEVKVGAFNVLSQGVSNCGIGFGELQASTSVELTHQSVFNDLNKFADNLRQMATYTTEQPQPPQPPQPSSSSSLEDIKKWTDSLLSPLNSNSDVRSWNVSDDHLLRALEGLATVAPYFFNETRTQDIVLEELKGVLSGVKMTKSQIAAIMSYLHGTILGLSLYGGFELGSNLLPDDATKLDQLKGTKDFQVKYFNAKRRFIEKQIDDFFKDTPKGILVCTEFDYPIVTIVTKDSKVQPCPDKMLPQNTIGRQVLACDENDLTVKVEHNTYVPHKIVNGETVKTDNDEQYAIHDNECIKLPSDLKYIRVGNKMNHTSDFVKGNVDKKKFIKTGLNVEDKILQASKGSPILNTNGNLCRVIIHKGFDDPIDMLNDFIKYETDEQGNIIGEYPEISKAVSELLKVKKSLVVDLLLFEDNLVIVAVHLDSTTTFKSDKEQESEHLLNLVKALEASGFKVIVSGDFNFPLLPKAAKGTPLYPDGFDQKEHPSNNYDTKNWEDLVTALNLNNIEKVIVDDIEKVIVGVAQKKRFHDTIGNDQFWEGKLEKRSYDTDFVGVGPLTLKKSSNNPLMQQYDIDIDQQNNNHPYVHYNTSQNDIDLDQSWLSDHILVHRTFTLPQGKLPMPNLGGGARKLKRSKNRRKKGSKKSKKNRRNRSNRRNRK